MPRSLFILAALLVCGSGACSKAQSESGQPAPAIALRGYVTDAAHVLPPASEARITHRLEAYERRTQHQLVVVTTSSLNGKPIAQFTRDLGNAWGIGRRRFDDGIIVLVAPKERKVRIEVGRGLEKTLTDDRAALVIEKFMIPRFKAGQIEIGVERGVDAVIEQLDEAEHRTSRSAGTRSMMPTSQQSVGMRH